MRLGQTLALFALILGLATGVSFLGYHYLSRASEFRERNVIHLGATVQAVELLQKDPFLGPKTAALVHLHVQKAAEQITWCAQNLNYYEHEFFALLGATDAIDLCQARMGHVQAVADSFIPMATSDQNGATQMERITFAVAARKEVEVMRAGSLRFRMLVAELEDRIAISVRIATALASLALLSMFAILARQLSEGWRVQSRQTVELNRISQRFSAAIAASIEGFALFDDENGLLTCNDRFRKHIHPDPDFLAPGCSLHDIFADSVFQGHLELDGVTEQEFIQSLFRELRSSNYCLERQFEISGNQYVLLRCNMTDAGDKVFTTADVTDIVRSENKQRLAAQALQEAKNKVEIQSLTDTLTNLANRRHLDRALQDRLSQHDVTLIRIDLDRFKKVNDILGHEAGDFVLQHVAKVLQKHANPDDLPARVGGDEFVVLCAADTSEEDAVAQSHVLLQELLQPVMFGNKRCHFGASFGVARGEKGTRATEVLSYADDALYRAKEAGRGIVELFTPEMGRIAQHERVLADRFAFALEAGEIQPYFQTQHDARTWDLVGVEVLARWEHPTEGLLYPGSFLGIAKQLGMETDLDKAIFDTAVARVGQLEDEGFVLSRTGFNVSAARIIDPQFLQTVAASITKGRERFVFEILETISCEDCGEVLDYAVDGLKDLGFQIDVDDFGSGHASINSVIKIQPDALKIDRNLIFPLGKNDGAERMVNAVLELARSLDVKVIAEGVDSAKKAQLLNSMGCDILQGFFFSQAVDFNTLRDYVHGGAKGSIYTDTGTQVQSG